jgi:hypothetical protein
MKRMLQIKRFAKFADPACKAHAQGVLHVPALEPASQSVRELLSYFP